MNNNTELSENFGGGIFPNEEIFEKIYDECLENAPERLKKAYSAMQNAFEEYISALEEYQFHFAYECGYRAAQKGGAVV